MSVMLYDSSEDVQSYTTEVWTQVFAKTGNLRPIGNFIIASAEYGGTVTNRNVGIRVLVDGVERAFDYHLPGLASQYKKFCDFGILTPALEGEHTLSIEVRALGTGQTVLVRRIRLMVFQV